MRQFNSFEEKNFQYLAQRSIEYTLVQITSTGFKKSILDATDPMRMYFKNVGMHDYNDQPKGPDNKKTIDSVILDEADSYPTKTSLYRPLTKKGDPRIWPCKLTKYCKPDDILIMIYYSNQLYIINSSTVNIEHSCLSSIVTPLKSLITNICNDVFSVSNDLTDKLKILSKNWHPSDVLADTGIGRAIESLLGIEMNNSPLPDYKGIELKSFREKRPGIRSTLFCQVPDWSQSFLKSGKAIVEKYGYDSKGVRTYQNTLRCTSPNSQNLGLSLYQIQSILAIEEKQSKINKFGVYPKIADVALWHLEKLHERLLEKHHETFWIEVESKKEKGKEFFRPIIIEHTKNPIVSQFDNLLDAGYITVDLLLSRPGQGGDTIAFKMNKKAMPMLFPEKERIEL